MTTVIAIPEHDIKPRRFASVDKAAKAFNTTIAVIKDCIESGSALILENGKTWFFDEALDSIGILRTFRAKDGEVVQLRGSKAFVEWSGYKTADALFQNQHIIKNKRNGKVYEVITEAE